MPAPTPARSGPGGAASPTANLAIATGQPGPDVLDVDQHGPAGTGSPPSASSARRGLLDTANAIVATPSGGLHAYFTGSDQPSGRLPSQHLDFRAHGGYILAPPSQVDGRPYQAHRHRAASGGLDWATVTSLLEPQRQAGPPGPGRGQRGDLSHLAAWVGQPARRQPERRAVLGRLPGRRSGDEHAVLADLAAAARSTGLPAGRSPDHQLGPPRRRRPFEHQGGREAAS